MSRLQLAARLLVARRALAEPLAQARRRAPVGGARLVSLVAHRSLRGRRQAQVCAQRLDFSWSQRKDVDVSVARLSRDWTRRHGAFIKRLDAATRVATISAAVEGVLFWGIDEGGRVHPNTMGERSGAGFAGRGRRWTCIALLSRLSWRGRRWTSIAPLSAYPLCVLIGYHAGPHALNRSTQVGERWEHGS